MVDLARKSRQKRNARLRRHRRVRRKVIGSAESPRLSVFRSGRHFYAQVIDDTTGETLISVSTLSADVLGKIKSAPKNEPAVGEKSSPDGGSSKGSAASEASDGKSKKGKKGNKKGAKAEKKPVAKVKKSGKQQPLNEQAKPNNRYGAMLIGEIVAERCKEKGIQRVVFDRGGYKFHGRIRSFADGARRNGLKF